MKELKLSIAEFRQFISDRKCICFGAGLQGLHIIYLMENWGKNENIIAFIDNNEKKWNTSYNVEGYTYPVISIEEARGKIDKDTVLVISCADVIGVKEQLKTYIEFSDIVCFSLAELAQRQLMVSDYNGIIRESQEEIIPRKIHYCWFGSEMPDFMKRNVEKWYRLCPDYEIVLWNEQNYDVGKNKYMLEAYEADKWGFVPDYIRLDIIYQYGGIYMDTDVELLKRPDDLLHQHGFAISDSSFFMNLGAGFGAAPKEEIIKEMRDYYEGISFVKEDGSIDSTPCMIHQYRTLRKYGMRLEDIVQSINRLNIYPMIMGSTNIYSMQKRLSEKAYFAHYSTGTWLKSRYLEDRRRMQKRCAEGLIDFDI